MRAPVRQIALLALLVAACTSEPEPPDAPGLDFAPATGSTGATATGTTASGAPATGVTGETAPGTPSDLRRLDGRLAVLDAAGNLLTMAPDGSSRIPLAEVDPGQTQIKQPAWSADGHLAWVDVTSDGAGAFDAVVTTALPDGQERFETATGTVPFMLSWDPTSSRVAYLGPSEQDEIEFGIVETGGRSEASAIDGGSPFYVSWAPSGEELLVHVGTERLERLALDGRARTVHEAPGTFNVPVWSDDTFVYGATDAGEQRLVAQDVASGDAETIMPFDGAITFVVSPDGERVAFQVFGAETSPLRVLDVASGETVDVIDVTIASYFWSPEGERLLYLEPVEAEGRVWFRWGVWGTDGTFVTPRFLPSETLLREYLPFFEQYAQVISLWSPDGRAFAYPGMNEAGETGIWVQEAVPDRAPVLISDGAFVTWSPV